MSYSVWEEEKLEDRLKELRIQEIHFYKPCIYGPGHLPSVSVSTFKKVALEYNNAGK